MLMMVRISLNLFVFLLICAGLSPAADAPDNPLITRTPDGQVTLRTLRPSGGVADFLPYAPDELLVRFKDSASPAARTAVHGRFRANTIKRFRHVSGLELLKLPQGISLHAAVKAYRDSRDVLYAEPNYLVEKLGVPNDPSFPLQWNLQNTGQGGWPPGADIKAVQAWDITTGSSVVVVAVIDTGIDYNHEDLTANMWRNEADCNNNGIDDDGNGYIDDCYGIDTFNDDSDPMDDYNHGTHVAGIIGAVGNNSIGVVGVAWNVKIMTCKFIGAEGFGTVADAIACLEYVKTMKDRGVDVVATNNSWGSYGFSEALYDAIDGHKQRGILFIGAAGNGNIDNGQIPAYPASYFLPNVISVGATEQSDGKAWYSNYGEASVHVGAPGDEIISTTKDDTFSTFSGTSMAAPHVAGLAALLRARFPSADWKTIKNLILAGGNNNASLANKTVTGKRINAFGSLTCSNSIVAARLWPRENYIVTGVAPVKLAALHINCDVPNGNLTIVANPGNQTVVLSDNGLGPDQVAGDGIYSGLWIPPSGGIFTLAFPGNNTLTAEVDPHLKPGFPVKTYHTSGAYCGGWPAVGNIDSDPYQEIVASSLAAGPVYAWKFDGSRVPGWPPDWRGVGSVSLGNLSDAILGFEVVSNYYSNSIIYAGSGERLPGSPLPGSCMQPTLVDLDNDGIDEVIVDGNIFRADGSPFPSGWSAFGSTYLAVADLDGDGVPEIVVTSGSLLAYRLDGSVMNGFPITSDRISLMIPVIADIDGDGIPEIIVSGPELRTGKLNGGIVIAGADGAIKRTIMGEGRGPREPAIADLDGDGLPEIIMLNEGRVYAFRGDGSIMPGWPVMLNPDFTVRGAVVGDVDGDGLPDIIIATGRDVRAYSRLGDLLPGFPKTGRHAHVMLADIDQDGRNDIIVVDDYWNGISGDYNKVWVYDLGGPPHGEIQWGQYQGGPQHQGYFRGGFHVPRRSILSIRKNGTGSGIVTSAGAGIDCGGTCSHVYDGGPTIQLSAVADADSVFAGWQGGSCTGTTTCTVSLSNDAIITATFLRKQALIVLKEGTGRGLVFSYPNGLNCWDWTTCYNIFPADVQSVRLFALPDNTSQFLGWSGSGCSGTMSCVVPLTADTTVTAKFEYVESTDRILIVDSINPDSGVNITVTTPDKTGQSSGATPLTRSYKSGTPVPLSAPATVDGKTFQKWLFNGLDYGPLFAINILPFVILENNVHLVAVYQTPVETPGLPVISAPSPLPASEVGLVYNAPLQITGGVSPYTISVIKGTLPRGLHLGSPTIVGTPTASGKQTFTIKVTDQLGSSVSKQFTLKIYPQLKVVTSALPKGRVGKNYNKVLKAKGGPPTHSWLLLSGNLPPGLNLDPSTRQIMGTPTSAGTFDVSFQVTDPLGGQAQKRFTLTVK